MDQRTTMAGYQAAAERALDAWLPVATDAPQLLHEAMRYAVLGTGKRIRPVLVYATGQALGIPVTALDGPACAVEFVHAYSLVHDDLPAMDNDDLRRGRPTCHRAFDEGTAILAGDALQALAFHVLVTDAALNVPAMQRLAMIEALAAASGSQGMAGGQALDLNAVGAKLNAAELETMHLWKTGALIRASVKLGALCLPEIDAETLAALDSYAKCVGLAFQVQDDILDIEGQTEQIGKPQGSDLARNKPTYPGLLGLDGAKREAERLLADALSSLELLGARADFLRWLAHYIVKRDK
jgi:geranylgeranyl diphosphate synthase, type II